MVKEVEDLRRSISSGSLSGNEAVAVEQAVPAAPFVLAGCLLTAVLGGSVASGIHALVGWVVGGGG